MNVLESLNQGLEQALLEDKRVVLLGEDLLDPYGGAFKVTKGLSSKFSDQVFTTPISEAGIVGISTGMAMRGLKPVVEIMFGDFITLAADQIINHASKFNWIYNNNVKVPLVIRTPMGGRRGYGPTHSQSLEKIFLGIPGLKIIAPNTLLDPGALLRKCIDQNEPVLFIEHKLLYSSYLLEMKSGDLLDAEVSINTNEFPVSRISYSLKPSVTIATYGYNFEIVRKAAMEVFFEKEIETEIILFSQLNPFDLEDLIDSVRKTRKLITFEEGSVRAGWGSEIVARISDEIKNQFTTCRIGASDLPIPNSKILEEYFLPSKQKLKERISEFSML